MEREKNNPQIRRLFDDCRRAWAVNEENLMEILRKNQDTEYGKAYGFGQMDSAQAYRAAVPLTEYDTYRDLAKNPQRFTSEPICCILTTSGTTGQQKEIPISHTSLERYGPYLHDMIYYLVGGRQGLHLHTSIFRPAVNGRMLMSSAYYRYLREAGFLDVGTYLGGEDLMFCEHIDHVAYVKLWLALGCADLVSIQSIFLYDVLILFSYLEENWRMLLHDLRTGTFSVPVEPWVQERLLRHRASDRRMDELEQILADGFETPIARRLWPDLRVVVGNGSKVFALQIAALRRYTGDLPLEYYSYGLSECLPGIPTALESEDFTLLPRDAFYEFVDGTGRIVQEQELEIGKIYELVLTTFSGLYRYRTQDLLEIIGFHGQAPVFHLMGRRGYLLNVAGEKVDDATARAAVAQWAAEEKLRVLDCSMGIDSTQYPCRYCLFAETEEPCDERLASKDELESRFDVVLGALSPDYEDVRRLGLLNPPRVFLVKKGWIGRFLTKDDRGTAHTKPHLFLSQIQTAELIGACEADSENV